MDNILKIAMAQIAPVWLDKLATIEKVEQFIIEAAKEKCELIVFGEGLIPGYPFWLALIGGAEWDKKLNKELHAHYVRNSIQIEKGELNSICKLAKNYFKKILKEGKDLKIITVGSKGLDQLKREYGKYVIKKISFKDKRNNQKKGVSFDIINSKFIIKYYKSFLKFYNKYGKSDKH